MRWLIRFLISFLVFFYLAWHVITENAFDINNQIEDVGFLTQVENWAFDKRMRSLMSNEPDQNVVIISVDEKSLEAIGQWPWPRDKMAEIVDVLFDYYDIEVLAFDITFPESDRADDVLLLDKFEKLGVQGPAGQPIDFEGMRASINRDDRLAKSFEGRKVVLGFVLDHDESGRTVGGLPVSLVPDQNQIGGLYELSAHIGNLDVLQNAAQYGGNFNPVSVDSDGKIRRVPMLLSYDGQVYESLSMATLRALVEADSYQFVENADGDSVRKIIVKDLEVPVGEFMTNVVSFRGMHEIDEQLELVQQSSSVFEYISAIDVLNRAIPQQRLQSTVALFGTTAAGLRDFRVTPIQENFPGVEIHANIISSVLSADTLDQPEEHVFLQLLLMIALALLMTVYMTRLSIPMSLLITILLGAAVVVLNIYMWKDQRFILPLTPSLVLITGLYFLHSLYGSLIESRRKKQLSKLYGKYVSPILVKKMEEDLGDYRMEPKDEVLSVLFADIVGFTKISENLAAEQVTEMLNLFLTTMTEIIQATQGTIDKYMGDALMAFWGAPMEDAQHAQHAMQAAFAMRAALPDLNQRLNAKGLPNINVCIGLNTGSMRVGDMGSEFREAYTVIGDEVNLAARIEGLTRIYGVSIIVGENTRRAVPDVLCLELDKVMVKGKDNPVIIYQPLGMTAEVLEQNSQKIAMNKEALLAYRDQNWGKAELLFEELVRLYPQDAVFQLYQQRINEFKLEPPPVNWDGVYRYTSK